LPLPLPTGCDASFEGIDAQGAFGADVDDFPLLRFIALLGSDAHYARRALRASPLPDATAKAIVDATGAACRGPIAAVAALRAMVLVLERDPDLASSNNGPATLDSIAYATSALAARSRIDATTLDAALARFGIASDRVVKPLDPDASATANATTTPEPESSGALRVLGAVHAYTCTSEPIAVEKRQPGYPAIARSARVTGTVSIAVHLDELGLVRFARVYSNTTGEDEIARQLVRAALVAAAGSTYRASDERCSVKPGAYLFVSSFAAR
jgi:hypothetical protein